MSYRADAWKKNVYVDFSPDMFSKEHCIDPLMKVLNKAHSIEEKVFVVFTGGRM